MKMHMYMQLSNKRIAENILFVDDNQTNVDGAKEVGMHIIKINDVELLFERIDDKKS